MASEAHQQGFKMGFQRSIKPHNIQILGMYVPTCKHRLFCCGKVGSILKTAMTPEARKKRLETLQSSQITFLYSNNFHSPEVAQAVKTAGALDHTSYLCVPRIVKDRISTAPFGLWGRWWSSSAIPSPFPGISHNEKKKELVFCTLQTVI